MGFYMDKFRAIGALVSHLKSIRLENCIKLNLDLCIHIGKGLSFD